MNLDEFLTPRGREIRDKLAAYMEKIKDKLNDSMLKDRFPEYIREGFREIGIGGFHVKGYGSVGLPILDSNILMYEITKKDVGLGVFMVAQ